MKVIISGASNTKSPWPTWADFVDEYYKCNTVNVSKKGMGNEAIITTALHAAKKHAEYSNDITVLIMLTNVDKWDWYVDDLKLAQKLDQEKHNITRLNPDALKGFWCTGSYFPLDKELFKKHYYSEEYFSFKSLQLINMFQHICKTQNWKYHIIYDSPIWSMTEQELLQRLPVDINSFKLIKNDLCQWLFNSSDIGNFDHQGLIGFLSKNNIPYHSSVYGPHPGPLAHLEYTKYHLFPVLNQWFDIDSSLDYLTEYANKMDGLWTL